MDPTSPTQQTQTPQNPTPDYPVEPIPITNPEDYSYLSPASSHRRRYLAGLGVLAFGLISAATLYTVNSLQTQKQYQPAAASEFPSPTPLPTLTLTPTPTGTPEQDLESLNQIEQDIESDLQRMEDEINQN